MEKMVGIKFDKFTRIDNTCPETKIALSNHDAGKVLSTTDRVNLVVGEGGVINWVVPGRRGEYNKKKEGKQVLSRVRGSGVGGGWGETRGERGVVGVGMYCNICPPCI